MAPDASIDGIGFGEFGGRQRRSQVLMMEDRSDMVPDHPECRGGTRDGAGVIRAAELLLDDNDAVMHINPTDLRRHLAGGCPPAERLVALCGSVSVAEVDVVAGQGHQGFDVGSIESVLPRQNGGDLRCGHACKLPFAGSPYAVYPTPSRTPRVPARCAIPGRH